MFYNSSQSSVEDNGLVVLLGETYTLPFENTDYLMDFRSKLWFSYRRAFAPITIDGYTSDQGWGNG